MRPERLEMEGFTAFRHRTVVDFSEADLFALSGPTGAGKSSVIDAIVFGLYGTVPRLADRRRVGPVVSQGLVEARLGLDFGVGPDRYRVVRVVRTTSSGSASTKEARLERRLPDGTTELLAGDADEVTRAVQALLGLTYEHFTTAVVLPQGEFARFLHHKAADRQGLLKELLDLGLYDRLQRRAGRHAKLAAGHADVARARLEELSGADPERAGRLDAQRAALRGLLDACDAARPALDELAGRLAEIAATVDATRRATGRLAAVHKPDGIVELAADHARAVAALAAAEADHERHRSAVAAAEAAVAALPTVAACERAIEAHARLERLRRQQAKGVAAADGQRQAVDRAVTAAAAAAARRHDAEQALQAARTAAAAAALAEHLHPGDDCPVCHRPIDSLPPAVPDGLAAASVALERAATEAAAGEAARRDAETELARIEAKLEQVTAEVDALVGAVADGPDLDTATRDLAAVQRADAALADARRARDGHDRQVQQARAALQRSAEAQQQAWAGFDRIRDGLAELAPPPAGRADLGADWDALLRWAGEERARLEHRAAATAAAATDLADRRRAVLDELRAHAMTVLPGLSAGPAGAGEVAELREQAVAADGRLAAERQRLDDDLERAERARAALLVAEGEEQVANEVARLLRADRFGAWILDEAQQQLVEGATGLLQRLSGGAYSLVLDGKDFAVVDHNNADAVRSARTLSGGETFLASLALALALAEQVVTLAGPTAAPLESLFLDEGFGTLDPDTLDTVATAIEELGSSGRMVGLVTHVRDLAERLPVRFEVAKGPGGATVERVTA